MADRYSRQVLHWGEEKQQKIEAAVVLMAGVGGLGATVAQLLVRSGVGKLYLVDDGIVDAPDLNRQLLYTEEDIGSSKLMLACDRLRRINSQVDIVPLPGRIDSDFALPADVQVVADCLDNYSGRFQLETAVPDGVYFVHAGLQGEEGQVLTLKKGVSQSLSNIYAGAAQPPGVIPVTGDAAVVVAGLMCNELLALIAGEAKLLDRCLVICLTDYHISFLDL